MVHKRNIIETVVVPRDTAIKAPEVTTEDIETGSEVSYVLFH